MKESGNDNWNDNPDGQPTVDPDDPSVKFDIDEHREIEADLRPAGQTKIDKEIRVKLGKP